MGAEDGPSKVFQNVVDLSKFALRRALRPPLPLEPSDETSLDQGGISPKLSWMQTHQITRRFLMVSTAVVGGLAEIGAIADSLGILRPLIRLAFKAQNLVDEQKKLQNILDEIPKPQEIQEGMYGLDTLIDLDPPEGQDPTLPTEIDFAEVGDSSGSINGDSRNRSVGEVVEAAILNAGDSVNVKWTTKRFSQIGAPSGVGFAGQKEDGVLGKMQMDSKEFEDFLLTGNARKVVGVWINNNDARELIENTAELSKRFQVLDNLANITPQQETEFEQLKAEFEEIMHKLGGNIGEMILKIGDLNARRPEGFPKIDMIFMYGVNLGDAEAIPAQVVQGNAAKDDADSVIKPVKNHSERGFIRPGDIPYGHQLAYASTAYMYTELNFWLPFMYRYLQLTRNEPNIASLSLYNMWQMEKERQKLEGPENGLFYVDGHYSGRGIKEFGRRLLSKFTKTNKDGVKVNLGDTVPISDDLVKPAFT